MPDISKLNAVAIGDIEKVDAIAKASISTIDGVAVFVAVSAPAAAYSVRLLDTAVGVPTYTGPAMRVRRDTAGGTGDDDEADIAFDSGVISLDSAISNASAGVTATTFGQFINVGTVGGTTYTNPDSLSGTASCFVDEWKDQSGNANHASQATFGSQPQIHSGTVNTDLITENGKPAIDLLSGDQNLSGTLSLSGDQTIVAVATSDVSGTETLFSSGTGWGMVRSGAGGNQAALQTSTSGDTNNFYGTWTTGNQELHFAFRDGTTSTDSFGRINGVEGALDLDGTGEISGSFYIGKLLNFNGYSWDGFVQEIIIWGDQSTNKTAIETDVNGFFSIY